MDVIRERKDDLIPSLLSILPHKVREHWKSFMPASAEGTVRVGMGRTIAHVSEHQLL